MIMNRAKMSASVDGTENEPSAGISAGGAVPGSADKNFEDGFDTMLDKEDDFDVEDDVAFLNEEYDVLDMHDVLDLCNMSKPEISDW
jgi:hypothetical protein